MGLDGGLVGTADTVPDGGVLAIVIAELNVVDGVVTSAVEERASKVHLIVNADSPAVDAEEEGKEQPVVDREQVDGDVVGDALAEAVHGVEGVAAKGGGVAIRVGGLVDQLVDEGVVQAAMGPVHQTVSKGEEETEAEDHVGPSVVIDIGVDFRVPAEGEEGGRQHGKGNEGDGGSTHPHFVHHLLTHQFHIHRTWEETATLPNEKVGVGQVGCHEVEEGTPKAQHHVQDACLVDDVILLHAKGLGNEVVDDVHGWLSLYCCG